MNTIALPNRNGRTIAALAALCLSAIGSAAAAPPNGSISFSDDIQPILANNCLECHGPDKQKGGLRLDDRNAAKSELDSGKVAVAPGKPGESELIRRVTHDDPDERMPKNGDPLPQEDVEKLRAWIAQGADWPRHWSYRPIDRPEPPQVENDAWVRNPIDRFVLAKLEANGYGPSPTADKRTLIRRLYIDLLGLPPSPRQVRRFVTDDSPGAYRRLVNRLLNSPRFGERWGRHWLDKARYADSDGYEKDQPRPNAWRYRDWVIDAINADMPFDRFTVEQLAGDLLPEAGPSEKLATAFHRQTLTNKEGGVDQEEFRIKAVFDRAETTGRVWLGMTVKCARCHDHKYDKLSQREYYKFFSFFNNADERTTRVPRSAEEMREYHHALDQRERRLKELRNRLAAKKKQIADELPAWIEKMRRYKEAGELVVPGYQQLEVLRVESEEGTQYERQADGSYLVKNPADVPGFDTIRILAKAPVETIGRIRMEAMSHDSLPHGGPGLNPDNGNFVLSQFSAQALKSEDASDGTPIELTDPKARHNQNNWTVAETLDGKDETGWATQPQTGRDNWANYGVKNPAGLRDAGRYIRITLRFRSNHNKHQIGQWRLSVKAAKGKTERLASRPVQEALATPAEQRTDEQEQRLLERFARTHPATDHLAERIEKLKNKEIEKPLMKVRILKERTQNPRQSHVFKRGDFLRKQDEVSSGVFGVLHEFEPRDNGDGRADRLDLARWIVDEDNPLTPRVTVNHIWDHLFGEALVRTMNDFGVRSQKPTHPDLLDWLADEFVRCGWSRKHMIRLIVGSATYRQASAHRPKLADQDPLNKLLHRQNRFRVQAEIVRDLHLEASGLLAGEVGGPSVFPPMPPDVADLSYNNKFKWTASEGADRYRRGMYTFYKRTAPHPNLTTFDCPSANTSTVDRRTSNTPLQALAMLNNKVFVEAARALGHRVLSEDHETDKARIGRAVRLCLSRPPTDNERAELRRLLRTNRRYYQQHASDAKRLIGDYKPDGVAAAEAAAWVATVRVVLNTDEFITRE